MEQTKSLNTEELLEKTQETIAPGKILEEEFLKPKSLTRYRVSQETGIPESALSRIYQGKRSITANLSVRLGAFLGVSPDYFLTLQKNFDVYTEVQKNREKLLANNKRISE